MTETSDAALGVEELDDRVVLTLSRPGYRNAIDQQMVTELHQACGLLEAQPKSR